MLKFEIIQKQFFQAISRLEDVLKQENNEYIRDSAIQRFEFTYDLARKTVKKYLYEKHGIICNSPKNCWRAAYQQGLIDYEEYWLTLTNLRNITTHTYSQEQADIIYKELPKALNYFKQLQKNLL